MRSAIRKQLYRIFAREFERRYSQFILIKTNRFGFKVWHWSAFTQLHFFVGLLSIDNADQFTVEIGWSNEERYPEHILVPSLDTAKASGCDRLSRLWQPLGGEWIWDLEPEEGIAREARFEALARGEIIPYPPPLEKTLVISRIEPAVKDCLDKFQQFAIPIFIRVAEHQNLALPYKIVN